MSSKIKSYLAYCEENLETIKRRKVKKPYYFQKQIEVAKRKLEKSKQYL